jgi:hypothetical protein
MPSNSTKWRELRLPLISRTLRIPRSLIERYDGVSLKKNLSLHQIKKVPSRFIFILFASSF